MSKIQPSAAKPLSSSSSVEKKPKKTLAPPPKSADATPLDTKTAATQQTVQASRARASANASTVASTVGANLDAKLPTHKATEDQPSGKVAQQQLDKIKTEHGDSPEGLRQTLAAKSDMNLYTPADASVMEGIKTGGPESLMRGHSGDGVRETQGMLNKLGFNIAADGMLGPRSAAALKQFQKASGLPETGEVNADTYKALQSADPKAMAGKLDLELPAARPTVAAGKMPTADRQQMMIDAIRSDPKIPNEWADDPNQLAAINSIVQRESAWRPGRPNYTITNAGMSGPQAAELLQNNKNLTRFGASSSAMGLFQLLGTNMDKYQPGGRTTIGDPKSEMIGGLRYMADRYGSPDRALAFHKQNNWW